MDPTGKKAQIPSGVARTSHGNEQVGTVNVGYSSNLIAACDPCIRRRKRKLRSRRESVTAKPARSSYVLPLDDHSESVPVAANRAYGGGFASHALRPSMWLSPLVVR